MSAKDAIQALIDIKNSEEERRKEKETTEIEKIAVEYEAIAKETMKEIGLDSLYAYGTWEIEFSRRKEPFFTWTLSAEEHLDSLEICPIQVHLSGQLARNIVLYVWNEKFGLNNFKGISPNELADPSFSVTQAVGAWLETARNTYPQYKAEVLKGKVNAVYKKFEHKEYTFWIGYNKDANQARALHAELVRVDPEQTEYYTKLLNQYLEDYVKWQQAKLEEGRQEHIKAMLSEEYRAAFRAWLNECAAVWAVNNSAIERVQKRLDAPVEVYELEYAVVYQGDMEKYVETLSTYVRSNKPSSDGYYTLTNGDRRAFFNVVSITKRTISASQFSHLPCVKYIRKETYEGIDFPEIKYVEGEATPATILEMLKEEGWHGFPPRPETPGIDYSTIYDIEQEEIRLHLEAREESPS